MNKISQNYLFIMGSLILIAVIILPYVSLISTYYHEKAHIDAASKYGVNLTYKPDLLRQIPNFIRLKPHAVGRADFITEEDKALYLNLENQEKEEINLVGIKSDYRFLKVIFLFLVILNSSLLFIRKIKYKRIFYALIFLDLILIMWGFWLTYTTFLNLFYPGADLQRLLTLWR